MGGWEEGREMSEWDEMNDALGEIDLQIEEHIDSEDAASGFIRELRERTALWRNASFQGGGLARQSDPTETRKHGSGPRLRDEP
jgi:hypothetical protein